MNIYEELKLEEHKNLLINYEDILNKIFYILNGKKIIGKKMKRELKDLGLIETFIGTSKNCYIKSGEIKVMNIKTIKYLNGEFLIVGLANMSNFGGGKLYRGFVLPLNEKSKDNINLLLENKINKELKKSVI